MVLACSAMVGYAASTQTTNTVLMVSPDTFQYDTQSVVGLNQKMAAEEFKQMAATLRMNKIKVIVLPSRETLVTSDAVFPSNWFSVHQTEEGKRLLVLYPMLKKNRRDERQVASLKSALHGQNIIIDSSVDLTSFEKNNFALEGAGSMVLDRKNKVVFSSLSPRTDPAPLMQFAKKLNFEPILFRSSDLLGDPIYYTNRMLNIGSQFAIIADQSITDPIERAKVFSVLNSLQKEIISISPAQMDSMAANILEVKSIDGKANIVMSKTAYNSFTSAQLRKLESYGDIIVVNIDTIEKLGGDSVRSMLAEIF